MRPSLTLPTFRTEAFSYTHDDAMTAICARKLLRAMPNAPSALRVLSPADVSLRAVGHVGAFSREAASALWT